MMHTMSKYVSCGAVLLTVVAWSVITVVAVRRERLIDTWRPTHYTVNITLSDRLTEITEARTTIDIETLKQTSRIDLDFGDLATDSVQLGDQSVPFTHKNGLLQVQLREPVVAGRKIRLTVAYHGKPKDGLILTNDKDGRPSAIGDNWPDRVHHWIPSFDHPSAKATVTFNVTAPSTEIVVANGKLYGPPTVANGNRIWTYNEAVPIPPYCMIIAVGQFAMINSVCQSVTPLTYYVPQSDAGTAQLGFAPAAPSVQMFSQTVAPYPYEKLALIVGATRFGGMENSSAIVFTSTLFNANPTAKLSPRFGIPTGIVDVVAHEIAHQWFGDSVTESTWSDLWLSEGFATYFAALFIQKHDGEEEFRKHMQQAAEASFAYEKKRLAPIFDRETEDLFALLNANNYQKGGWVLHMLRSRLGDDKFFRGIRMYYEQHKNSNASTEDLRAALEKTSGENLRSFFARWIYDSGHPRYKLVWNWDARRKQVRIVLRQLQEGNVFVDPVEVVIKDALGNRSINIIPRTKETVQFVPSKDRPSSVEVDPRGLLLKEVL